MATTDSDQTASADHPRSRNTSSTISKTARATPLRPIQSNYNYCGGDPVNRVDPMGTYWTYFSRKKAKTELNEDELPFWMSGIGKDTDNEIDWAWQEDGTARPEKPTAMQIQAAKDHFRAHPQDLLYPSAVEIRNDAFQARLEAARRALPAEMARAHRRIREIPLEAGKEALLTVTGEIVIAKGLKWAGEGYDAYRGARNLERVEEGTSSVRASGADDIVPNGWNSNQLPRSGTTGRPVINQNSAPLIPENACAPTSAKMIQQTAGRNHGLVDFETLIRQSGTTPGPLGGTRLDVLADTMRKQGFSAARYDIGVSIDAIKQATRNGNPFIASVSSGTRNVKGVIVDVQHAVVVDGVTIRQGREVLAIRDPAGSQYFLPVEDFKKVFSGQGVFTNP